MEKLLDQLDEKVSPRVSEKDSSKFDFKGFRTFFKKEAEPVIAELSLNEKVEALKK